MPDIYESVMARFDGIDGRFEVLDRQVQAALAVQQDRYRGVKHMRMPLIQATGANPFSAGESTAGTTPVGPAEGFAWCITRWCITGLTTGATPDVVNIFRGSSLQEGGFLWQLNGNSNGVTFGNGEMVLMPGDRLQLASQGTFASTALITFSGELNEVPAEMLAKLLLGGGS